VGSGNDQETEAGDDVEKKPQWQEKKNLHRPEKRDHNLELRKSRDQNL
jgi:hypothetical protein